jgi:hypothetical protein
MAVHTRLADALLGTIVAVLTAPTGLGAGLAGWVAARRSGGAVAGTVTGAVVGLVGAAPWAALVYLASAGAIDPVGYHEGLIHVGINPAAPETFVLWQEVGLAVLVGGIVVAAAAAGGFVAGSAADVAGELRSDLTEAV